MSKLPNYANCVSKTCGRRRESRAAKKGDPLRRVFVRKFIFQANRPRFDRRCTMMKCSLDGLEQDRSIKSVETRERPQIEEIFHPTIQRRECRQSLQLLGNNRLFGIGTKHGSREFQKRGVFNFDDSWVNYIAEPDIDLHWDASTNKDCPEANPDSFVVRVLFDSGNLHGLRVELDTIWFGFDIAQLREENSDVLKLIAGSSEQIDVHGSARKRRSPGSQQERAFENEFFRMARPRQAVQEALHRVILEQFLKGPFLSAGLIKQTLPHRGAKIASQSMASRYGCMTFSTRQMRAYSSSLLTGSLRTFSR